MIIFMSDIICVTNRALCEDDFLERIEKIASCRPKGIILREKDMEEAKYRVLAAQAIGICSKYDVTCILHSFIETAIQLKAEAIHLPMHVLRSMDENKKKNFKIVGASCHSVDEAKEAESLGCTYITAGHVFATDCKKGVAPRGLDFLRNVCKSVSIPVYAIGGISERNIAEVIDAGAKGACIMSGFMKCSDVKAMMKELKVNK